MSRHYHDDECTPAALESIVDRLDDLIATLKRIADALDRDRPTERQREDEKWARTAAAIRRQPPDAIGAAVRR